MSESNTESLREIFHKEKKQKKNNKTNGQIDNLKKYGNKTNQSSDKSLYDDKQIKREANFIKNIHIDETYQRLRKYGLIADDKYHAWWCKTMHTLGCQFILAQADIALSKGKNPQALFHFLVNKAMNASNDPLMPRLNRKR